ncbi:MAG: exosortase/archaeosortase family protein [Deltaproteobacteria bacterium]|nr:exosortase/archaeosortase family protein [Deltaproteobacteria bacterium]
MRRLISSIDPLLVGSLGALALLHAPAIRWLVGTWTDESYQSWGFLPLLLALAQLRHLGPRRAEASAPHLRGLLLVAATTLLVARLELNVLLAALALLSLQLWVAAYFVERGRWYLHPRLWLGLLSLPAVYWGNALVGHRLQELASQGAATILRLYGLPLRRHGAELSLGETTLVVDASCSGIRLLYVGLLLGLLTLPSLRSRTRQLLGWMGLLVALVGANTMRVVGLAAAQLHLGRPLGDAAHQSLGLVAFVVVAAPLLVLLRERQPSPSCSVSTEGSA